MMHVCQKEEREEKIGGEREKRESKQLFINLSQNKYSMTQWPLQTSHHPYGSLHAGRRRRTRHSSSKGPSHLPSFSTELRTNFLPFFFSTPFYFNLKCACLEDSGMVRLIKLSVIVVLFFFLNPRHKCASDRERAHYHTVFSLEEAEGERTALQHQRIGRKH